MVGRNATLDERKIYVEYDTKHNERKVIADQPTEISKSHARIGGETGIDIGPTDLTTKY